MYRLPGPATPLGHARWGLGLACHPTETLLAAYERWGPVSALGWGPFRWVLMLGRDANELILSTRAKDFTWREAFASLIPVDGDTALVVSDGADHARRRRLVQPAFALRRIHGYAPIVIEEVHRTLDTWTPGDRIDLYAELRRAVRRIAIRSLFGDRLGDRADELGDRLQAALDFANIPPFPGRDLDLPGSPFRRAMKERRRADAIVFDEISRRRAEGTDEGDLLSALIKAQDSDGSVLNDQELRDQVVSLIAAGYETTAALVGWALYAILSRPQVEASLRAELGETFGDGPIDEGHLDSCPYLHGVISETLRLHSPAGFAGRKLHADIDFAGHTIPAGTMVIYSAYVTHRQPELWPDPLVFRPQRWIGPDGRPVDPQPYAFVPFGGGYRRCIGFAMATLEAKIIVAETLRRTHLRLETKDVKATGMATVTPGGGLPATVA